VTTNHRRIFLLLALGACLAVAGCGGDDEGDPIPAQAAQTLQAELDRVQARLDDGSSGACRDILEAPEDRGSNLEAVQRQIEALPGDVDPDVRSALEESFARLWDLVESECDQRAQQEQEAQPDPEPEPEPDPVVTETETTETVPPPEDELPPEEQELPPEGDGDNEGEIPGDPGGGVGPGNGNGNGNAFGNEGEE
jgi:hypothetical protein